MSLILLRLVVVDCVSDITC